MVEPENAPRRVDASLAALSLLRAWTQAEAEALHATATGAAGVEPAEAARVRAAVAATPGITDLVAALAAAVDAYTAGPRGGTITMALGCTGGRHRAPTTAEMLATVLRGRGHTATVAHRDLTLPVLTR